MWNFLKSEQKTKKLWLACGPCRNHLQDIKTWCGVSWICSLLRRHVLKSKYVAADFSRIYKYTHLSQQDHLRVNNNTGSSNHLGSILQIDRSIRSFQINDHLEQQIKSCDDLPPPCPSVPPLFSLEADLDQCEACLVHSIRSAGLFCPFVFFVFFSQKQSEVTRNRQIARKGQKQPKIARNSQKSEVIEDHRRSLEVFGGHWRSLEVIGGHWRSWEVIGGHSLN